MLAAMNDNLLKPCPFCGNHATLEDERLLWAARCTGCGACVLGNRAPEPEQKMPAAYWEQIRQSAVEHWNRRTASCSVPIPATPPAHHTMANFRSLWADLVEKWDSAASLDDPGDVADVVDRARSLLVEEENKELAVADIAAMLALTEPITLEEVAALAAEPAKIDTDS